MADMENFYEDLIIINLYPLRLIAARVHHQEAEIVHSST